MATTKRTARKPKPEAPAPVATLPNGCKPSKACSTDKTRPIVTHAYIRDVDGKPELHATTTYTAVRLPLRVDGAVAEGFVPVEALKRVEALKKNRDFSAANGRVEVEGGKVSYARPEFAEHSYPDLVKLWPEGEAKKPLRIGLNAKLLYELAQSMGSEGVAFELDLANVDKDGAYLKPYRIKPLNNAGADGAEGLLMPIRVHF